jgi:hypothetical protein
MLASQPSSFSSIAYWPNLQDTITHQHNNYHIYTQTNEASESLVDHCPPFQLDHFTPSTSISSNPTTVQKLCHNARERTRRRRINVLFSTLRSVLPAADDPMVLIILIFLASILLNFFFCMVFSWDRSTFQSCQYVGLGSYVTYNYLWYYQQQHWSSSITLFDGAIITTFRLLETTKKPNFL